MKHINLLNLPVAVATILFRRFIDGRVAAVTPRTIPGGFGAVGEYLNPNIIYIYMIGAGITYIGSHLKKGTMINLARKCSASVLNLTDKCLTKKRWLKRNNSWIIKSLLSTRENQQKALSYLSTQIPNRADEVKEELMKLQNNKIATSSSQKSNNCLEEMLPAQKLALGKVSTAIKIEPNDKKSVIEARPLTTKFSEASFFTIKDDDDCFPENNGELNRVKNTYYHNQGDYENYENPPDFRQSVSTIRSAFDIYTPSVIREIIPSDCDETGVEPAPPRIGRLMKKRKPPPTNRRKPKPFDIRKTRSGRVYYRGTPCLGKMKKT